MGYDCDPEGLDELAMNKPEICEDCDHWDTCQGSTSFDCEQDALDEAAADNWEARREAYD
jgi:hypothetical protein